MIQPHINSLQLAIYRFLMHVYKSTVHIVPVIPGLLPSDKSTHPCTTFGSAQQLQHAGEPLCFRLKMLIFAFRVDMNSPALQPCDCLRNDLQEATSSGLQQAQAAQPQAQNHQCQPLEGVWRAAAIPCKLPLAP